MLASGLPLPAGRANRAGGQQGLFGCTSERHQGRPGNAQRPVGTLWHAARLPALTLSSVAAARQREHPLLLSQVVQLALLSIQAVRYRPGAGAARPGGVALRDPLHVVQGGSPDLQAVIDVHAELCFSPQGGVAYTAGEIIA